MLACGGPVGLRPSRPATTGRVDGFTCHAKRPPFERQLALELVREQDRVADDRADVVAPHRRRRGHEALADPELPALGALPVTSEWSRALGGRGEHLVVGLAVAALAGARRRRAGRGTRPRRRSGRAGGTRSGRSRTCSRGRRRSRTSSPRCRRWCRTARSSGRSRSRCGSAIRAPSAFSSGSSSGKPVVHHAGRAQQQVRVGVVGDQVRDLPLGVEPADVLGLGLGERPRAAEVRRPAGPCSRPGRPRTRRSCGSGRRRAPRPAVGLSSHGPGLRGIGPAVLALHLVGEQAELLVRREVGRLARDVEPVRVDDRDHDVAGGVHQPRRAPRCARSSCSRSYAHSSACSPAGHSRA